MWNHSVQPIECRRIYLPVWVFPTSALQKHEHFDDDQQKKSPNHSGRSHDRHISLVDGYFGVGPLLGQRRKIGAHRLGASQIHPANPPF